MNKKTVKTVRSFNLFIHSLNIL